MSDLSGRSVHRLVYFYKNVIEAAFDSFYGIYLIKFIYESIENRVDFHKLFVMVSIFCVFHIIVHLISAILSSCILISEIKIYRYVFQGIIRRAKKIEISQYENPKFYDNFSRVLDEALEQGFGCLFLTVWGVGCVCGSAIVMAILASVDIFLLVFAIPPVLGSLYFGMKESGEEFAARREETYGKRKMEYAKRVFYEKKYAGELRLYPMAQVLFGIHKDGYLERYEKNKVYQRWIGIYRIIETLLFAGLVTLGSYCRIQYVL